MNQTVRIRTTTDFWKVLRFKNVNKIKKIWEQNNVRLKNEKCFLQILMIIAILSNRFEKCAKKFRLVFEYFGPHFDIRSLRVNLVTDCLYDLQEVDEFDYETGPQYETDWSFCGNHWQNPVYISGYGDIQEKIEKVGFLCVDSVEDVTFFKYK